MYKTFILAATIACVSSLAWGANPIVQDSGADGIVSVQAEDFDSNTQQGSTAWEFFDDIDGFTGTGFMRTVPDGGGGASDFHDNPRLNFEVKFVKTGIHYVWVRGYRTSGTDDSVHMGLDDDGTTSDRIQAGGTNNTWEWSNNRRDNQGRAQFDVTEAGIHTVNAWMREDGWRFDKLVLTTNQDYTPADEGPPESSRGSALKAGNAMPEDSIGDVIPDVVLAWTPGEFSVSRNVYLGTSFDDVNTASVGDPLGVLVSEGQDANTYDPAGDLEFGQTYYWRVDEVNGAPDRTVNIGDVWRFTVEPVAYPIAPIAATASSSSGPDTGPEKTIDSSGLVDGLHGTLGTDMWLSGPGDPSPYIQFELDQVYKLHEMMVWNSNQMVESFIGLGVKEATVELSLDGDTWTAVEDVPEFNQAPGANGYAANTVINLGNVMARFVRITVLSGYGMVPQYGLSEVTFSYIPVQARELEPVGAVAGVDVTLKWRPGREAVTHEVVLSADEAAVIDGSAVIATATGKSLDISDRDLQYSTVYYWRVNEVNEAGTPPRYEGEVVSFTTPDYGTVDDFDQYNDQCQRIFFSWEDGLGHNGGTDIDDCDVAPSNGNGGGSIVGNDQAPFAERTIVNIGGSRQSMPFNYDNAFGASEATLRIDGKDWSGNGIQTLSLAFRGEAGNTGTLYVKINNNKISYDLDPTHIASGAWLAWNIDLSAVSGLQNVTSFTIGVDGANASGMLYIDDIRLYPVAGELITPADPGTASLVAKYSFEGDASDSSGNGHNGTVEGNASFAAGKQGNALSCDGFDDFVSTGRSASALGINGNNPRTVTCWAFTRAFNNGGLFDVGERTNGQDFCLRTLATDGNWRVQYWGGAFDIDFTLDALDTWIHFTHVYDGAATQIYANGVLVASGPGVLDTADTNPWQIGVYGWQNDFYDGLIDELHLFNRALSAEEALFMAGHTGPIHRAP